MAVVLGGVTLPDLTIDREFSRPRVEARTARTLGGGYLVAEQTIAGRAFDLVGEEDAGWIDRETLEAVHQLAEVPNATYTLEFEGELRTVRFRREDGAVIEAEPILPRPNQAEDDRYRRVRLKLMEMD